MTKTKFELDVPVYFKSAQASIIGTKPKHTPYVSITITRWGNKKDHGTYPDWIDTAIHLKDEDLERFAVNILKALKSKRLKP